MLHYREQITCDFLARVIEGYSSIGSERWLDWDLSRSPKLKLGADVILGEWLSQSKELWLSRRFFSNPKTEMAFHSPKGELMRCSTGFLLLRWLQPSVAPSTYFWKFVANNGHLLLKVSTFAGLVYQTRELFLGNLRQHKLLLVLFEGCDQ